MTFNPADYGATPADGSQPQSSGSFDPSQYGATLSTQQPSTQQSPSESIWSAIANYGNQVLTAAQQGAGQINDAGNTISTGAPGQNPIVAGTEAGLQGESGLASVISSPIAPLMKPVGDLMQAYGNWATSDNNPFNIGGQKQMSAFANSPVGQTTSRVAQDLSNAGNVAGTILGADQVAKAVPKVVNEGNATPFQAHLILPKKMLRHSKRKARQTLKPATDAHVQATAKDWQAPTTLKGAAYNKARAVIAKSPEAPTTLAGVGLNPIEYITDGKYDTAQAAEDLRSTTDQISQDLVRPSLVKLDQSDPIAVKATDLSSPAKDIAANFDGVTDKNLEQINAAIDDNLAATDRANPDGMSREDLHDNKITYSQNAGYNPIKDDASNNNALANKAIGLAMKQAVEDNVPADTPVGQANAQLSKQYAAADYLESLDNKKAPVSTAQSIVRYGAKVAGAAAGRALFGGKLGDLVTTFVGYKVGGALENVLENMTNAGRAEALSNLQTAQPAAFAKLQSFLNEGASAPK